MQALAESISEFEPSSASEDDNVSRHHGDCVDDDDGDDDDDTKGDGCHGDVSEHRISDIQSISSGARLVTLFRNVLSLDGWFNTIYF